MHEDDRPRVLALLEEILHDDEGFVGEHLPDRAARRNRAVDAEPGRADRDADGSVTRLTGLDLDFTEHRRTEEALQARRDEEHDRALRTLLETATQGIVSVDAEGMIVTANHAFEAMFGWAAGELIGQPIERLMPSTASRRHERRGGLEPRRRRARTARRFRSKSA